MEKVLHALNAYGVMEASLIEYIQSVLKRTEIKKNTIILKEGTVERYISFIDTGIVRGYKVREQEIRGKGKVKRKVDREMTSWFMMAGDIFVSVRSFFKQLPAKESIQALEDCVIYSITFDQYTHILKNWPDFNLQRAEILQKYYIAADEREDMRQQPAYEKFVFLMENQPELVGKVADKYLASYLSISPKTYSDVKREYQQRGKNSH